MIYMAKNHFSSILASVKPKKPRWFSCVFFSGVFSLHIFSPPFSDIGSFCANNHFGGIMIVSSVVVWIIEVSKKKMSVKRSN